MKTMKLIDLLNKIARDEETPLKISYRGEEYTKNSGEITYRCFIDNVYTLLEINTIDLNNEVKIIEEVKTEEKEIEKIYVAENNAEGIIKMSIKINELIDVVNELKKGDKNE